MFKFKIKEMIKAGIHYGHLTKYWNPKMKPYIYNIYNNIHIINLEKTASLFKKALINIAQITKNNKKILMIGTKKNASKNIKKTALLCNQYFINHRWLGGILTNWKTVQKSIKYLNFLEEQKKKGIFNHLIKKELLLKEKKLKKLKKTLGGIQNMNNLPDAIFVIDALHENIAIKEAQSLGIKIFAVIDTNSNPDTIDYIIPGNDDSKKSIIWYLKQVSLAIHTKL